MLLSRRDVAVRFGVSPQTVTRWAKLGMLPCVRTLGGQRRYPADEVERLASMAWAREPSDPASSWIDQPPEGGNTQP
jgi:excisionase family DNA binding protein